MLWKATVKETAIYFYWNQYYNFLLNAETSQHFHLLNPWQISEKWSIWRLVSSPMRPPPLPPSPTPSTILKQEANIEMLFNYFPGFVSVTKRSSSCKVKKHFVCFLLVSESTIKVKLGRFCMAEQPILLFLFSFLQVTLLYHSIFCFGYNFIVTLYRRQRFIR